MITFDLEKVVVGGLGVTGRAITAALTARGHEVVVLDDDPESVANIAEGFEVELLDSKSENTDQGRH
ncbi:MAG: NAD-binding protein [Candidatus Poriferisodalaceae bacterium]